MKYSIYLLLLIFGFSLNTPLHSKNTKNPIGVTAKEIETFGKNLQGKVVQMTATLCEVSDTWVRLKLEDDRAVGLYVWDSKGDLFQYAFASKEKYGRALLQLKKGDKMLLTGTVRSVDETYVLMVHNIQR